MRIYVEDKNDIYLCVNDLVDDGRIESSIGKGCLQLVDCVNSHQF